MGSHCKYGMPNGVIWSRVGHSAGVVRMRESRRRRSPVPLHLRQRRLSVRTKVGFAAGLAAPCGAAFAGFVSTVGATGALATLELVVATRLRALRLSLAELLVEAGEQLLHKICETRDAG